MYQIPKIIFEDKDLLVVEKPAGMVVNKADTTRYMKTLQEWAEQQFKIQNLEFKIEERGKYDVEGYNKFDEFLDRSGIVHRLDKETSGLILIAKNPQTFIKLQNQFKSGEVEKKYIALVHGELKKGGEINERLGRLPWNRTKFGVLPEGRDAVTKYKVLGAWSQVSGGSKRPLTLLEVSPRTGRTHQIRVHMKHIGYPIFADELYAGRKTAREDRKFLDRHFLHASEISLKHPVTSEKLTFKSALPDELESFLSSLEQ